MVFNMRRWKSPVSECSVFILFVITNSTISGCAIHYYDKDTGVEHLVGFGHMKMKVSEPNEGVKAVVTGTEAYGFAAGTNEDGAALSLGWARSSHLKIMEEDASVRIEWPTNSLFNVRVGTEPPFLHDQAMKETMEKNKE